MTDETKPQESAAMSPASAGSIVTIQLTKEEIKELGWAADEALRQADSFFFGSVDKQRRAATLRRVSNKASGR